MNVCKDYTMEQIYNAHVNSKDNIVNQNMSAACSCHLDDDQFKPPYITVGSIPQVCTPLCNASIPAPIPFGFDNVRGYATCDQNVCVMDNIAIDLTNSIGSNVNLSQVCGNCSDGQCSCYLDSIQLKGAASAFSKIDYTQKCGQCLVRDPITETFKQVPCLDVKIKPEGPSSSGKKFSILIMLIIFFVIMCIIIGLLIFVYVEN
jgi:Family of unknown function (DUF5857)